MKREYIKPIATVIELQSSQIICASPDSSTESFRLSNEGIDNFDPDDEGFD